MVGGGKPGPTTFKIIEEFRRIVERECEPFEFGKAAKVTVRVLCRAANFQRFQEHGLNFFIVFPTRTRDAFSSNMPVASTKR